MKSVFQILLLLFFFSSSFAQPSKFGSDADVKKKLNTIKKALPDLKKNLTKESDYDGSPAVTMQMGDGEIDYAEEDNEQMLIITYSRADFPGTLADYQDYYKKLTQLIKEVFGSGYELNHYDKKDMWSAEFAEKGKEPSASAVRIELKCIWKWGEDKPKIELRIYSKQNAN